METRNLILAIVLSVGVLLLWTVFIEAPRPQINQSIELSQQESIGEIAELETEKLNQILWLVRLCMKNLVELYQSWHLEPTSKTLYPWLMPP